MKIVRNGLGTMTGPAEWFAGDVYIDVVSPPAPPARIMGGVVRFTPGARTAWHTHPFGQTIHVTEGISLVQREGGPVEEVKPGDSVHIEPGENHWHGATSACFTTQIAYQAADDSGTHTVWGRRVTDEEYSG
ncbi:cupin domain-containing protein [Streptomyces sp. NPDC051014]|uniref:(R)-mandelonitrile lyase n=1 Tax=Streptomyces sp. NPDC051014 TaxID=3155751 RepID=UPI003406ADC8